MTRFLLALAAASLAACGPLWQSIPVPSEEPVSNRRTPRPPVSNPEPPPPEPEPAPEPPEWTVKFIAYGAGLGARCRGVEHAIGEVLEVEVAALQVLVAAAEPICSRSVVEVWGECSVCVVDPAAVRSPGEGERPVEVRGRWEFGVVSTDEAFSVKPARPVHFEVTPDPDRPSEWSGLTFTCETCEW